MKIYDWDRKSLNDHSVVAGAVRSDSSNRLIYNLDPKVWNQSCWNLVFDVIHITILHEALKCKTICVTLAHVNVLSCLIDSGCEPGRVSCMLTWPRDMCHGSSLSELWRLRAPSTEPVKTRLNYCMCFGWSFCGQMHQCASEPYQRGDKRKPHLQTCIMARTSTLATLFCQQQKKPHESS